MSPYVRLITISYSSNSRSHQLVRSVSGEKPSGLCGIFPAFQTRVCPRSFRGSNPAASTMSSYPVHIYTKVKGKGRMVCTCLQVQFCFLIAKFLCGKINKWMMASSDPPHPPSGEICSPRVNCQKLINWLRILSQTKNRQKSVHGKWGDNISENVQPPGTCPTSYNVHTNSPQNQINTRERGPHEVRMKQTLIRITLTYSSWRNCDSFSLKILSYWNSQTSEKKRKERKHHLCVFFSKWDIFIELHESPVFLNHSCEQLLRWTQPTRGSSGTMQ